MNVFLFFQNIFTNAYNLLNYDINLGGGIHVTLFGVFIGITLLGLVFSVIKKLFF